MTVLLGYKLPYFISKRLFGDRRQFGLDVKEDDPCWQEWLKTYSNFYYNTQKQSIGSIVNNAGYKIMSQIELSGKHVLEVGPGNVEHITHWQDKPACFYALDINESLLNDSVKTLKEHEINHQAILQPIEHKQTFPIDDNSMDMIISFYSLEHLRPLENYLLEMKRVLKPGGLLVGAIPLEGGFAWGAGRFLTSRRWLKNNTNINPDKIICWEHPNFADLIFKQLNQHFSKQATGIWPFRVPVIDMNLVGMFIYQKDR